MPRRSRHHATQPWDRMIRRVLLRETLRLIICFFLETLIVIGTVLACEFLKRWWLAIFTLCTLFVSLLTYYAFRAGERAQRLLHILIFIREDIKHGRIIGLKAAEQSL